MVGEDSAVLAGMRMHQEESLELLRGTRTQISMIASGLRPTGDQNENEGSMRGCEPGAIERASNPNRYDRLWPSANWRSE